MLNESGIGNSTRNQHFWTNPSRQTWVWWHNLIRSCNVSSRTTSKRVVLARAGATLYLLDDPLAAVNAHIGKALYNWIVDKMLLVKSEKDATSVDSTAK
jgi:hypothetical protein